MPDDAPQGTPAPQGTSTTSGASPSAPSTKPQRWYDTTRGRVILMVVFLGLTAVVVARSINPDEFTKAFKEMNPWWFLACFFAAMPAWYGAAVTIVSLAPKPVPIKGATLVQVASSFVGVATPAGLGPTALTIRFLVKNGLSTVQAIATVVLSQIAQFAVSIVAVIAALITTGMNPEVRIPWATVGWVVLGVVALLGVAALVPKWRDWAINELRSVWASAKPAAIDAFHNPTKLWSAIGGAVLQVVADSISFIFAIMAFGDRVNWLSAAGVYLVFKTIGGLMPSPGGVGTVEGSLTAGLAMLGISAAKGVTISVGYRLATFYAPIVIGWFAMRYLRHRGVL